MQKLLPYFFSFVVVAVLAIFLFYSGFRELFMVAVPEPPVEELPAPEEPKAFTGRVVMPDSESILVLENSADRDIKKVATYFSGRAAGLHWLARPYFKKHRDAEDVIVGIRMTIDSLGRITCNEIEYTNAEDESLKDTLQRHIEYYWRYRKSEYGTTEIWLPIRFRTVY
jgi:hypothetical protein